MDAPRQGKSRWLRLLTFGILLIGILASLLFLRDQVAPFLQWLRELGDVGLIVLALAYVPAALLLIPGSLLTLFAGFAYNVVRGSIAIWLGANTGAAAAFLVARYMARDLVEEKIKHYPRFQALDQAVAQEGFKIVLLTRLSPAFPYTFLNYAYGLTKVRFRDYAVATAIGMIPGTVMYVYLGSLAGELTDLLTGNVQGGVGQKILFGVGLLATLAVTIYVTRLARRALDQRITPGSATNSPT